MTARGGGDGGDGGRGITPNWAAGEPQRLQQQLRVRTAGSREVRSAPGAAPSAGRSESAAA